MRHGWQDLPHAAQNADLPYAQTKKAPARDAFIVPVPGKKLRRLQR